MQQAEKVPELAVRLMGGGQEMAKEVRRALAAESIWQIM